MIRKMEAFDTLRVAEIHVFGWRGAYRGIVSDEHLFNKMSVANSVNSHSKYISNRGGLEIYVYDDGIVKGYLVVGPCRDGDKAGSFELMGIYVDFFFQRQNIGKKLVGFCFGLARERRYNNICLWVFEKNIIARRFYEGRGFAADGARMKHLDAEALRYYINL